MSLLPVDTSSELAVTSYLQQARDWLAQAVETTGPEQIANAKAEIATAAEATKQLGLSKEIQLDAQEMVRRAEFALGKAIRKGQAEGTIHARGHVDPHRVKTSVSEFFPGGKTMQETYAMTDGVDSADFEAALDEARHEGQLSRANVVRKIKQQASPTTRDQRADLIAELAEQGYTSQQMAERVGVIETRVREIARSYDIEIPGDRAVRNTKRPESMRIATTTVTALEGLVMGVELIDYGALDPDPGWTESVAHSMQVLNKFARKIKEISR